MAAKKALLCDCDCPPGINNKHTCGEPPEHFPYSPPTPGAPSLMDYSSDHWWENEGVSDNDVSRAHWVHAFFLKMHVDDLPTKLPRMKNRSRVAVDIFCSETVVIQSGDSHSFKTKLFLGRVPPGYFVKAEVRSRMMNTLLVGGGVIDPDYQDEIFVGLWNCSRYEIQFVPGDTIGQMYLQPFLSPDVTVSTLHKILNFERITWREIDDIGYPVLPSEWINMNKEYFLLMKVSDMIDHYTCSQCTGKPRVYQRQFLSMGWRRVSEERMYEMPLFVDMKPFVDNCFDQFCWFTQGCSKCEYDGCVFNRWKILFDGFAEMFDINHTGEIFRKNATLAEHCQSMLNDLYFPLDKLKEFICK